MKMADMALLAELTFRDGERQKLCVHVENNTSSLINGINELNVKLTHLLSELVEQEKARRDCTDGELPSANNHGNADVIFAVVTLLIC